MTHSLYHRRPDLRTAILEGICKELMSLETKTRDKFMGILVSQCQGVMGKVQVNFTSAMSNGDKQMDAKLLEMVADAEPACGIDTSYPMSNLAYVDIASVRKDSSIYQKLRNALSQVSPTDTGQAGAQDIRLIRSTHGLAIWSIQEFSSYRDSFQERLKNTKGGKGEDMWLDLSWQVQQLEP